MRISILSPLSSLPEARSFRTRVGLLWLRLDNLIEVTFQEFAGVTVRALNGLDGIPSIMSRR